MATSKPSVFLLFVALPLGIWGYAYEFSYFRILGISPHETLGVWHYVVSGGALILLMLIPLLILGNLKKFFTKGIHEDDIKSIEKHLGRADFPEAIKDARLAVVFSVIFWLAVYFQPHLPIPNKTSITYLYVVFVNLAFFYSSIALSPPYSRPTVVIAFVVSVALCFSAGGIGAARNSRDSANPLRDDHIVRIERIDGKLNAVAKAIPVPASWLTAIKRIVG